MAKLMAVKLLPSPGNALVTMIRLPFVMAEAPLPVALLINGRLMTRNWSATWDRGALGVTIPEAATNSKSMLT